MLHLSGFKKNTGKTHATFCNFSLVLSADNLKNMPNFSFKYLKSLSDSLHLFSQVKLLDFSTTPFVTGFANLLKVYSVVFF